jgi:aromatic-L-amino-acid decarboxylase
MDLKEFRQNAHQVVDWLADYLENIDQYAVMPATQPYQVYQQLPNEAPQQAEDFATIFKDFEQLIVPNMTHWQNPSFFAYFPANSSSPSLLAEMLTAGLAAQCMSWQTSPAATELEEMMMKWLGQICGIPADWHGVIQDTASTGTLTAILTAREHATQGEINHKGLYAQPRMRVYCSSETHSSIEKAVKIAGLGKENVVKIAVDENFAMLPAELAKAIAQDRQAGYLPLCVVATIGTTSSTAIDPLRAIGEICQAQKIWLHVDAAYAGTVTLLPEKRHLIDGIELADSYLFNPHKWMFTNFDCTAYFVKDKKALLATFEILPEYLKTALDKQVNNYRDWGIQLGRRFRALKLWFVMRSFGVEGLQAKIRLHLELAQDFAKKLKNHADFELLAPVSLNLVCFRYHPATIQDEATLEKLNSQLMHQLNATGKVFLTHTKLNGKYTLRVVIGQTNVTAKHLTALWELLLQAMKSLG